MISSPKVSLIISNLNGREMLRDCLNSLKKLNYSNYEIIVVDAASTDGAPEMVRHEFPDVILIDGKNNLGFGEAINIGIMGSKGEIIAFGLNNDEVFSRDWLRILVKELLSTTENKIVGGTRLIYGKNKIIDAAGARTNYLGNSVLINHNKKISDIQKIRMEVDYLGCPVFNREILNKIGLCDEKYFFYFEDSDFCEKAKKFGYKIINVYPAISYHRRSTTIGIHEPKTYYFLRRNKLRFIIKHYSILRLLVASTWWFLTIFIDALKFFPLTQRFLLLTGLLKTKYKAGHIVALVNALNWNLRNISNHFKARIGERAKLRRWEFAKKRA